MQKMTTPRDAMRVNETRFLEDFSRLTRDGATPEGGLNRPALSEAHLAARETFREMIKERGFSIHEDNAGNLSACHTPSEAIKPVLLLGSHLDSVANGGRFDGALGIAAAFEVLQVLRDHGTDLGAPVEVIDFTDEEGTWVSLLGSRAMSGQLTLKDLTNPRGDPEAFRQALQRAGLSIDGLLSATRPAENLQGYLELHIEQGTRLERSRTDIGVVTGMVGIHMYLVTFLGQSNHAGTTPMNKRRDAALGAAEFSLMVRETVMDAYSDCVATVGRMDFSPGAFNIVANRVTVFMELRSEDATRAGELEQALREASLNISVKFGLKVDFQHLESVTARKMASAMIEQFESSVDLLGLSSRRLPSLAGHDAQSMATLCPAGLIFVPSAGGFSHSFREYTPWEACVRGANVLLHTAMQLVESSE